MKLSLILEAKLNRPWLEKQLGIDNPAVQKIVDTDPTGGSYYKWLTALYQKSQSDDFLTPELKADIGEWANNARAIKSAGLSSDLNGKDLAYFYDVLAKMRQYKAIKASHTKNSGAYYLFNNYPGAEAIYNDGNYIMFKVEGKNEESIDSLQKLGIGTGWCTRLGGDVEGAAEEYLSDTQYVLYKNGEPICQFSRQDFKDVRDEEYKPPADVLRLILKVVGPINDQLKTLEIGQRIAESNNFADASPEDLCRYAVAMKQRWPEAEPIIKTSPKWAREYALNVLGETWPDAEPYIMTDPQSAVVYAIHLKGRWPEAEKYIKQDPGYAILYARKLFNKGERFLEAEPYIEKDARMAFEYAQRIIKGEWPDAEKYIMQDPQVAYNYAAYVREDRWPAAEPIIMRDPQVAYKYAYAFINGEWPEAEPYIMTEPYTAYAYARFLKRERWPEAEPYIKKNPEAAKLYFDWVNKDISRGADAYDDSSSWVDARNI